MTLTDVALTVGLPPSTTHRLLTTMQHDRIVRFDQATALWHVGVEAFVIGNALDLPFADAAFDAGYTQNVSMSVPDKARFFAEAARVLRPGARFVAGEVAQGPGGDILYPVPWAMTAEISHLTTPEETAAILEDAGFHVEARHDSTDKALVYNQAARERAKEHGPPILSPLIVLMEQGLERMRNSARNVEQHRAIPIEFVCIRA